MQTQTASLVDGHPGHPAESSSVIRTSKKATWALVCGIAGMVVFAPLFATIAITLGVVAKTEMDRDAGLQGRGRAVAGIVLGVIGLALFALFVVTQLATA